MDLLLPDKIWRHKQEEQKFCIGLARPYPDRPKQNFCFDVNGKLGSTWCVTLYTTSVLFGFAYMMFRVEGRSRLDSWVIYSVVCIRSSIREQKEYTGLMGTNHPPKRVLKLTLGLSGRNCRFSLLLKLPLHANSFKAFLNNVRVRQIIRIRESHLWPQFAQPALWEIYVLYNPDSMSRTPIVCFVAQYVICSFPTEVP